MKIWTTTSIIVLLATPVYAEIFKCEVDGRVVFTDKACDADAEPIMVEMVTRAEKEEADRAAPTGPRPTPSSTLRTPGKGGNQSQNHNLDQQIKELGKQIEKLDEQIDYYFFPGANAREAEIILELTAQRSQLASERANLILMRDRPKH